MGGAALAQHQDAAGASTLRGTAPHPLPAVSLPKGGGAIRGIGEKFGTNPVTAVVKRGRLVRQTQPLEAAT